MRQREILRLIDAAKKKVDEEIRGLSQPTVGGIGARYAGGLSSEGYAGGYRDALADVRLLFASVGPHRRHYWDKP